MSRCPTCCQWWTAEVSLMRRLWRANLKISSVCGFATLKHRSFQARFYPWFWLSRSSKVPVWGRHWLRRKAVVPLTSFEWVNIHRAIFLKEDDFFRTAKSEEQRTPPNCEWRKKEALRPSTTGFSLNVVLLESQSMAGAYKENLSCFQPVNSHVHCTVGCFKKSESLKC